MIKRNIWIVIACLVDWGHCVAQHCDEQGKRAAHRKVPESARSHFLFCKCLPAGAVASRSTTITARVRPLRCRMSLRSNPGGVELARPSHLHAPLSIHALSVTRRGRGDPVCRKDKKPRVHPAQMVGCAAQMSRSACLMNGSSSLMRLHLAK
jgi:hypothetical protein